MASNPLGIGVSTGGATVNTGSVTPIGRVIPGGGIVLDTPTIDTGTSDSSSGSGAAPASSGSGSLLSTPPFNPGGQITVPTAQGGYVDSTSQALQTLGNLFSGAFASGSPSGVSTGGASPATENGSTIDPITGQPYASEAIDPATGVPYADEGQTPPATTGGATTSGTNWTTWILIALGALGAYFAYRQLHKKKAAA